MTYQQTRWSLANLFPGPKSAELDAAFVELENQVEGLETRRAELTDDIINSPRVNSLISPSISTLKT